jgi:hypothetical protein
MSHEEDRFDHSGCSDVLCDTRLASLFINLRKFIDETKETASAISGSAGGDPGVKEKFLQMMESVLESAAGEIRGETPEARLKRSLERAGRERLQKPPALTAAQFMALREDAAMHAMVILSGTQRIFRVPELDGLKPGVVKCAVCGALHGEEARDLTLHIHPGHPRSMVIADGTHRVKSALDAVKMNELTLRNGWMTDYDRSAVPEKACRHCMGIRCVRPHDGVCECGCEACKKSCPCDVCATEDARPMFPAARAN